MANPFKETTGDGENTEAASLDRELTFSEMIDLAKQRAVKEINKKLLDDTERLWSKLMSELEDPAALEKYFLRFIELKLNAVKSNESKR